MIKRIILPLAEEVIKGLKAGEEVLLSGKVYTARDQAHKKLAEAIVNRRSLPIEIKGQVIYYCGPTPARPGRAIGSCGPTTSKRMDIFTPALLSRGLKGMIGKGRRSRDVIEAIRRHGAVYFVAIGGAGAYLAEKVKRAKVVAFKELGPEAVYELSVAGFPAIVAVDSRGRDIFRRR